MERQKNNFWDWNKTFSAGWLDKQQRKSASYNIMTQVFRILRFQPIDLTLSEQIYVIINFLFSSSCLLH
jgi:hypothetical protein